MVTLSLEDLMRDIAIQFPPQGSDSTLIARLVTADRYEREAIENELERRANDRKERTK